MARGSKWEDILKKASIKAKAQELHERNALKKFVNTLKRLLTVELLIGIIAAFSLYAYFGWEQLFRTLLNWTIGITLASTVVTFMVNRYKKLLHLRK
ncbi:hypothetical protein KY332_00790 [Candidatus Woesearchaeota archaeon]|nr:hypothetical protein [Candidatus Woesearchaeota archaeon]